MTTAEPRREWSIQEIARLAGTTSRTLRHYDDEGLLAPSRVGASGYRFYDAAALVRLQRVLLLRSLGLGVPAIRSLLERQTDAPAALRAHLDWLRAEQQRLARQVAAVQSTIDTMDDGGDLMAETMFDGFEHTQHRKEVTERWGAEAYAAGDSWWTALTPPERAAWKERQAALAADWAEAAAEGLDPAGAAAQELAQRQVDWLLAIPGTPREADGGPSGPYLLGLGDLYVSDSRFATNYGGADGAAFVRDALAVWVGSHPHGTLSAASCSSPARAATGRAGTGG